MEYAVRVKVPWFLYVLLTLQLHHTLIWFIYIYVYIIDKINRKGYLKIKIPVLLLHTYQSKVGAAVFLVN